MAATPKGSGGARRAVTITVFTLESDALCAHLPGARDTSSTTDTGPTRPPPALPPPLERPTATQAQLDRPRGSRFRGLPSIRCAPFASVIGWPPDRMESSVQKMQAVAARGAAG